MMMRFSAGTPSGGRASSLSGSTTLAFTSSAVKFTSTIKKAMSWKLMSIMGVISPSMTEVSAFLIFMEFPLPPGLLLRRYVFEAAHEVFAHDARFQDPAGNEVLRDIEESDRRNGDQQAHQRRH